MAKALDAGPGPLVEANFRGVAVVVAESRASEVVADGSASLAREDRCTAERREAAGRGGGGEPRNAKRRTELVPAVLWAAKGGAPTATTMDTPEATWLNLCTRNRRRTAGPTTISATSA